MNEVVAREVLMLQAFETAQPAAPSWGDDDRAWATQHALQDDAVGASADTEAFEAFIAARARHAMQRLAPREPLAAGALARRLWRWRWVGWAMAAAFIGGLLADSIGSSQRINLLAPPLLAVLVWNGVVYLGLLGHALLRLLRRPPPPGALIGLTGRVLRLGRAVPGGTAPGASGAGSARALQSFAALWLRSSAPLSAARAATVLHAAAAALALGLIAGLYGRGLVLDYRAGWESTFLDAPSAHAILAALLAPAAALSGIALPDVGAFDALRSAHGVPGSGASAAPWLHLLALTLALVVVLPRALLALGSAARARWLARHVAVPLDDPYYQRLARLRAGDVARVFVVPYASPPGAQAAAALRALLAPALGDGLTIEIAPTLAFGAEDDAGASATPVPGTTLAVALFDLAATPEAENQGRFAQQLAARAPAGAAAIMLVDEAAFARRFSADPTRLAQRRDAWRRFAQACGSLPVFADLDATRLADPASAARAVQLAMRSPVQAAA